MQHVDVYLAAWKAIDGRVNAKSQAKYLVNLDRLLAQRGRHQRPPIDAFLLAMSALATTDVEPPVQKTLVNALIHHHRRDFD